MRGKLSRIFLKDKPLKKTQKNGAQHRGRNI